MSMITTKADDEKRVVVPQVKPGQTYAIHENPDGSLVLSLVEFGKMLAPTCRVGKEDGFTVAVPGQPIDEGAIDELLADFP